MNMKRFENIDCCKCLALLAVLIYHYWVLSGSPAIPSNGGGILVPLGGEIGVTMFFVLSGFGIYCLFKNNDQINWFSFMKSRFVKIAPLYYFSIILVIGLMLSGAAFFSKSGLLDIVTHALFIHSFIVRFHGSINGALWTMGIIFQYYFVAKFLYKCIEKNRLITVLLSIIFTILMKMVTFKYILPTFGMSGAMMYFIYGRQLVTALDNFVIGMYAGAFVFNNGKKILLPKGIIGLAIIMLFLILWGKAGLEHGVYIDNIRGYLWHSVLALICGGIVIIFGVLDDIKYMQALRLIGKNEYGIYLLHLPILQNLLQSPLIQQMNAQESYIIGCICFLFMALIIGIPFNYLGKYMS